MTAEGARQACGKTPYHSKRQATQGAVAVARRQGDRRMRPYLCPRCHFWHLTADQEGARRSKRRTY